MAPPNAVVTAAAALVQAVATAGVPADAVAATVAAASADDELTTGYSPGEYVPIGTKHFMRVVTTTEASGNYYVYGYAMSAKY